jgi:ABC-type glycerol-3-phosphate transport system substrate-binding protein
MSKKRWPVKGLKMQNRSIIIIVTILIIAIFSLDACSSPSTLTPTLTHTPVSVKTATATSTSGPSVEFNYWLWNDFQMPAYKACATEFTNQHHEIKIKFQWYAWVPYWDNLNIALKAGKAPDVFTNT